MNERNQPIHFERSLYKDQYFLYGSLELPKHIKAYFDGFSSEYNSLSDETRFFDLGFVLLRGYNIKKVLGDWIRNHPEISEESIVTNIGLLMLKFDDVNTATILKNMHSFSLNEMLDFFKPIFLDCYLEEKGKQIFDDLCIANSTRRIDCKLHEHYLGEIHPNGKWQWTEYKPDKYDWRSIK